MARETGGGIDLQQVITWLQEQHEEFGRAGKNGNLTWEMHYQGGKLRTVDFDVRHRLWWERRRKPPSKD